MTQPNPIVAVWNIAGAIATTKRPAPSGSASFDHGGLESVLRSLKEGGLPVVAARAESLDVYIGASSSVMPDALTRGEALAFWLNLYNAGAIRLAVTAMLGGHQSVLRVRGGFTKPFIEIDGERLSLDAIEHAKIRRFGDPRIHGALVCGSVSCPTVRFEPFTGPRLDGQLDDQMRSFLTGGGAVPAPDGSLSVSRVFRWYGGDFVRPDRMPTFWPASKRAVSESIQRWLPESLRGRRKLNFQAYDWALGCSIA